MNFKKQRLISKYINKRGRDSEYNKQYHLDFDDIVSLRGYITEGLIYLKNISLFRSMITKSN